MPLKTTHLFSVETIFPDITLYMPCSKHCFSVCICFFHSLIHLFIYLYLFIYLSIYLFHYISMCFHSCSISCPCCLSIFFHIVPWFWVNYKFSLTRILWPLGDHFPIKTMIPGLGRTGFGRDQIDPNKILMTWDSWLIGFPMGYHNPQ